MRIVDDTPDGEYRDFIACLTPDRALHIAHLDEDLDSEEILDLFPAPPEPMDLTASELEEYDPFTALGISEEQRCRFDLNIVQQMQRCRPFPLAGMRPFDGAGCYMLFYNGPEELYRRIRVTSTIYAGCAELGNKERPLYERLLKHRNSIGSTTLGLVHFHYRFLKVTPEFIRYAENVLIRFHTPVWNGNICIGGFGSNGQGGGRNKQLVSEWDTLHPGRPYANELRVRTPEEVAEVRRKLETFLRTLTPRDHTVAA